MKTPQPAPLAPEETAPDLAPSLPQNDPVPEKESPAPEPCTPCHPAPQSLWAQVAQLAVAGAPALFLPLALLWAFLGGSLAAVLLLGSAGALCLALLAYWALNPVTPVSRRRFATAYFLCLGALALGLILFSVLAFAFGGRLSPVLTKLINAFSTI